MRFLSSLGCAPAFCSACSWGCSGTPPATPVTKLITTRRTPSSMIRSQPISRSKCSTRRQTRGSFTTSSALSRTEEPDENNYVYVVATCFMTTGKRYRVHGLSGLIVRDVTNTYWLIPEEIILHAEDVGVYDGELTVTPFINLSGPSGPWCRGGLYGTQSCGRLSSSMTDSSAAVAKSVFAEESNAMPRSPKFRRVRLRSRMGRILTDLVAFAPFAKPHVVLEDANGTGCQATGSIRQTERQLR